MGATCGRSSPTAPGRELVGAITAQRDQDQDAQPTKDSEGLGGRELATAPQAMPLFNTAVARALSMRCGTARNCGVFLIAPVQSPATYSAAIIRPCVTAHLAF